MFFIFKVISIASILVVNLIDSNVDCKPFSELNEHIADSGQPNSKISYSTPAFADQQEKPEILPRTDEISLIDDCDTIPPTVILNRQLIVDYKYAYFHHDDEDVQQTPSSFFDKNHLEPNILCTGDECNRIDK